MMKKYKNFQYKFLTEILSEEQFNLRQDNQLLLKAAKKQEELEKRKPSS
jgi:hypothetical protein